jgi:hypothetical protein
MVTNEKHNLCKNGLRIMISWTKSITDHITQKPSIRWAQFMHIPEKKMTLKALNNTLSGVDKLYFSTSCQQRNISWINIYCAFTTFILKRNVLRRFKGKATLTT